MGLFNHPDAMRAVKPDQSPVEGASRFIFKAGTDNLCPIFQDRHLTYTVGNPMMSDENGYFPDCFLLDGTYRVRIEDRFGKVLMEADDIAVVEATSGGSQVQTTPGNVFAAVDSLLADQTLSYVEGEGLARVNPGDTVRVIAPAYGYTVVSASATDYHCETTGGVRLRALPNDASAISTGQLGWVNGTNISTKLSHLFAHWPAGATVLRQDGDFLLSGDQYTFPSELKQWLSDDYERLPHGEQATRSILFMDLISETATANGISVAPDERFILNDGCKFGGIRFDHNVEVEISQLVSGGNGAFIIEAVDQVGMTVDKCRFDFAGGAGASIDNTSNWFFTNNYAGPQKIFLSVNRASDFGLYHGNKGRMGYIARNVNDTADQIFGDYIKTGAKLRRGPRYCVVSENQFLNSHRDGPDGTGGFLGWKFINNYFDVAVAAIDVKQPFSSTGLAADIEADYSHMLFQGNTCVGCGVVITDTVIPGSIGDYLPSRDRLIRTITSIGNHFIARPNSYGGRAFFLKGYQGGLLSVGDTISSFMPMYAGDWDASSGGFPSGAKEDTYYRITGDGTVDGVAFVTGDCIWPLVNDAATDTFADNWAQKTGSQNKYDPRLPGPTLLSTSAGQNAFPDQGTWNPSSGSFPTATDIAQAWKIEEDGVLDGVQFYEGDWIVAAVVSPSTTTFRDNWAYHIGNHEPHCSNVEFRSLFYDARGNGDGAEIGDSSSIENLRIDFAEAMFDSDFLFDFRSGVNIDITGRIRGFTRPVNDVCFSAFRLGKVRGARFDVDFAYTRDAPDRASFIGTNGANRDIWVDGRFENLEYVFEGYYDLDALHLGRRSGLKLHKAFGAARATNGTIGEVWKGVFENPEDLLGAVTFGSGVISHNDFPRLEDGFGRTRVISGGVIEAVKTAHRVDTQSEAATDDLDTINGGVLGDRLVIAAATNGRTVVARTGTGNLSLGADRTLDNTAYVLTLEKRADNMWHEVVFDGAS